MPKPGVPKENSVTEGHPESSAPESRSQHRNGKTVDELSSQRNTRNLGLRLGADVASALGAASLVAPLIYSIDRSIIENASGRNTISGSLLASLKRFVSRPHRFIFSKPFGLILMLYTGTFTTANIIDTASSTMASKPAHTTTAGPAKFFATSFTNLSLCLYKDRHFTQLFGATSTSPRPVALPTYLLFATRDALTIFASFNLPPLIAPHLPARLPALPNVSQASVAQFLAPAGVQLLSTPLHLLGLDLYNRPGAANVPWHDRMSKVARQWAGSSLARMGRIVPAFGIGGVVNAKLRRSFMDGLA